MSKTVLRGIAILLILMVMVGCNSLPDKTQEAATRTIERAEIATENSSSESASDVPLATAAEQVNISDETIAKVPVVETHPVENIPPPSSTTHTVNLIDGGFDTPELDIKVGDTVVWQNVREGHVKKALILAVSPCVQIKSSIFLPGSSYKYTFSEARTCIITDGIFTTQTMKVIVTE